MSNRILYIILGFLLSVSIIYGSIPEEEILILTKPGTIIMPEGQTRATLDEIGAIPEIIDVLEDIKIQEISKAMPDFNSEDTARIAPDGNIARLPDFSNLFILRLPENTNRDSAVILLETLSQVIYAEKNEGAKFGAEPNDPNFLSRQWNLYNHDNNYGGTPNADIKAREAWDLSTGSNSIILGIVDRGIDRNHQDLNGKVFGDTGYYGNQEHGTTVAGIAAAKTNNSVGIAGVDWNAQIYAGKGFSSDEMASAIIRAVDAGAKVINCSWGFNNVHAPVQSAMEYAFQMGVLLVVCNAYAGLFSQAVHPQWTGHWVLNVSANGNQDELAAYCVYYPRWYTDITAPGGNLRNQVEQNIYTTVLNNGYEYREGTSFSAPHATGVAGLLLTANSGLKNYDLEWIIKNTANDLFQYPCSQGWDEYSGYGRLNAFETVKKAKKPYAIIRGNANLEYVDRRTVTFSHYPHPHVTYTIWDCEIYKLKFDVVLPQGHYIEPPLGWFSLTGYFPPTTDNTVDCREFLGKYSSTSCIRCSTYFYKIVSQNVWCPVDPNLITPQYTILGRGQIQPDNQIKNYWGDANDYIGNNIYNSTGINQNITQFTETNLPAIYHIKIENDGIFNDYFRVRAIEEANVPPTATWTIQYFDALTGGNNITSQITSTNGWTTNLISPGGCKEMRIEVTPASNVPQRGVKKINIDSYSVNDPNKVDRVYMVADLWNNAVKPDLQIKNSIESSYLGNNVYNIDGAGQTKEQIVWRQPAIFHIKIERDGEQSVDGIAINGPASDNNWNIRYYEEINGITDITDSVVNGTYLRIVTNPIFITMKVTPVSVYNGGIKECLITGISGYNPRKRDAVKTITKFKNPWIVDPPIALYKSTYPNTGKHMMRTYNTRNLHLVFVGDDGIIYANSQDDGEQWYFEEIDNGLYPCVGLNYRGLPWIAYCKDGDLLCKIKRDDDSWKEILIFDGDENHWAGPPSMQLATMPIKEDVIDYAYITYAVYDGSMPDGPGEQPPSEIEHSYIYVSLFDTTGIDIITHQIDDGPPDVPVSHPCVGVTPSDLIHIAWQQKDEIWYITNTEKVTPENWRDVQWTSKYNLSYTGDISEHPFVESYGDLVSVVWKEGNPGEIIKKERYVWEPSQYEKWSDPVNHSNSPDVNSDYPQISTGAVCVWQEEDIEHNYKVYCNILGEVICITPDANNISYVHTNVLVDDPQALELTVYYCYTDEITENELYEVKFDKFHYPDGIAIPPPQETTDMKYYEGKLGEELTSPYCEQRTGYIDYGEYTIDYGNTLEYQLKYLNPCKYYLFQAIVYQDTTGTIRQKLEVEDTLETTMRVYPTEPETINIYISPCTYQEDLESALEIVKTRGAFACLAEFKIYEYEVINDSGSTSGGPQSSGTERLPIPTMLYSPRPNPFNNRTAIKFQIPVKSKVNIKIYNSTGRLVKILVDDLKNPGVYNLNWDGKDDLDRIQSKGIYFVRLKTNDYNETKKIIMVR